MPVKGVSNNPAGKPKGTVNKTTATAREAIARFVDGNTARLQGWLDKIAAESPEKAFNCVRDLMEYHLPKMARTEHTGPDGGAIAHDVTVSRAVLQHLTPEQLQAIVDDNKNNA